MFEASYVIHRALFRLPIPSPSSKHHQTPVAPWVSAQWETRSSLSCQEGLFYVAHRCGASLWRRVRDAHRCGKRIGLFSSKDLCIAKPRGAQLLHRGGPSGVGHRDSAAPSGGGASSARGPRRIWSGRADGIGFVRCLIHSLIKRRPGLRKDSVRFLC